jgi:epoxyqueuosine reductase
LLSTNTRVQYSHLIKTWATELGFEACGISKAEFLEDEAPLLESWLEQKMQGEMRYMEHYFDKRLDPRLLVDGAKSVISLLFNYYPPRKIDQLNNFKISKYAYGEDYHFVVRRRLNTLLEKIQSNIGVVSGRGFVDSAPVMDKAWAKKAGIGWIGKHTNLINRKKGSFLFVAELIIDLELTYDLPVKDYCGTCTKCIDACPTEAIVAPYVVDGSKCISYYTIELKENIPQEMKGKFNDWIFGCDICQDVCPWNRFSTPHTHQEMEPNETVFSFRKEDWKELNEVLFQKTFKNTALQRTKFKGLKRNIQFVAQV